MRPLFPNVGKALAELYEENRPEKGDSWKKTSLTGLRGKIHEEFEELRYYPTTFLRDRGLPIPSVVAMTTVIPNKKEVKELLDLILVASMTAERLMTDK